MKTRVLLADDHLVLTDALVNLLKQQFDIIGVAKNGTELIAKARDARPDVIVIDISMPDLNGIDAARKLREEQSPWKLLFLSRQMRRWLQKHSVPAHWVMCLRFAV